jgi:hypothetical protein
MSSLHPISLLLSHTSDPSSLEESLSGSLKPIMVRVQFWLGVYVLGAEKEECRFLDGRLPLFL